MSSVQAAFSRAAFWLTGGAAVAVIFSIALSQILLALALATLLFSDTKLRLPPIRLPLALFMVGTVVSLMLSADPTSGRPQIRKFFVLIILLVVYSTFRDLAKIRALVLCWAGVGAIAAARGLVQFGEKYREAQFSGQSFYQYYVGERISGFMSNWMTFGGHLTLALLLLAAFVFFSPQARRKLLLYSLLSAVPLAAAFVLGLNRGLWLAAAVAGSYLLWCWKRWVVLLPPLVLAVMIGLSPGFLRDRVVSIFRPHGDMDSNQFRIVCWRTGWEMIKAHPWFGLGPEQVRIQFDKWVPPDIPRPLPTGWYGHLHNIYIHYAAERGVPTMLVLVWLLVKILFDFLAAVRKTPPGRSEAKFLLHGSAAVVLAVMAAGLFELNLGDSEVLTMFLAVVACGYVARDEVLSGGATEPA